jgi:polar amino acid transport system substrate-binding protein
MSFSLKPAARCSQWFKRVLAAGLGAMMLVTGGSPVAADGSGILDRIAETGVIRAGTRASAAPFASLENGRFSGFSVDLLHIIAERVGERLDRTVSLQIEEVSTQTRLQRLEAGSLDIVCGLTTPTWRRERRVDFTVPIFVDGTRILTWRRLGQRGLAGLEGRRVGVLANSTTERIVALALPSVRTVAFDDMAAAIAALKGGEVSGVANIGVLLESLRADTGASISLMLVPSDGSLKREFMSCVVPENNSDFRDTVNRALVRSYDGLRDFSGTYADIYFRWFGVDGEVYYPLTNARRDALLAARIWAN